MTEIENGDDMTIFVGRKPASHYVATCFDMINNNHLMIWVEGMGQNIVKVIDIVNYFRRFWTQGEVNIADFKIDMIPRRVVHGLPKHVSRLRLLLKVEKT